MPLQYLYRNFTTKENNMADFISEFMKTLGPQVTKQMSSKMNIDSNTAEKLIPQIAPLILGGLKKQKDEHGGEARIDHILNKYGKADALDDIAGIFSKGVKQKNPDPDLGGLLGGNGLQAVTALSKQFNLKGDQIAQLIPMLSPLILGSLTKKRDTGGAGSSGVAALLDSDGDGSILDDVAGFLIKGQGGKKGSGLLGNLVGGLLRRKR
jgi:hypothetical protein